LTTNYIFRVLAKLPTSDGTFHLPIFVLNNTYRYNYCYNQDLRGKISKIKKEILFNEAQPIRISQKEWDKNRREVQMLKNHDGLPLL
jgi:hypothetical protein